MSLPWEAGLRDAFDDLSCGNGFLTRREFCARVGPLLRSTDDASALFTRFFDPKEFGSCGPDAFADGFAGLLLDVGMEQTHRFIDVDKAHKTLLEGKLAYLWDSSAAVPVLRSAASESVRAAWSLQIAAATTPTALHACAYLPLCCMELFAPSAAQLQFTKFDEQVGGHKGDAAMLRTDDAILKPLNFSEWLFYENIEEFRHHPRVAPPPDVFPAFRGRMRLNGQEWLMLENLCCRMKHPSILDLKVGSSSLGHTKSGIGKKIKQKVVRAITTSHSLGFRVAGFKVWHPDTGTYEERDKKYGISLTAKTMVDAIRAYLTPSEAVGVRFDVAVALSTKLKRIREWMQTQTQFSFNSSSILMLYDQESQTWDLRMIDFAHCYVLPGANNDLRFLTCRSSSAPSLSTSGGGGGGGGGAELARSGSADDATSVTGGLGKVSVSLDTSSSGAAKKSNPDVSGLLAAPERKPSAAGTASPRSTSKKSLQLTRLQGSADALVQPQAEPHIDTAYVNALNHLISIFDEILGGHAGGTE